MRSRGRDWDKIRSTHAAVLSTLEQVVARHPSNHARSGEPAATPVAIDDDDDSRDAPGGAIVLPFRRRLALVHGDDDGPSAA